MHEDVRKVVATLVAIVSCSSSGGAPAVPSAAGGGAAGGGAPQDGAASDASNGGSSGGSSDGSMGGGSDAADGFAPSNDASPEDARQTDTKGPSLARKWTARAAPVAADLFSLASNGDVVVAAGSGGLLISSDGIAWQVANPAVAGKAVAYGGGVFAAIGDKSAFVSSDGRTWTPATIPGTADPLAVAYGAGQFIAPGGYQGAYISSTDGATWKRVNVAADISTDWANVLNVGGAGDFLFTSKATLAPNGNFTSRDGVTWSRVQAWIGVTYDVWFDGRVFCATGTAGQAYRSTDGTNWTMTTTAGGESLRGVASIDGVFFTVGTFGTLRASKDCAGWEAGADPELPTQREGGATFDLYAIRPHKGRLIAVGKLGTILTSP